jgi:hypothetical protein
VRCPPLTPLPPPSPPPLPHTLHQCGGDTAAAKAGAPPPPDALLRCAHCPRVAHPACLADRGFTGAGGAAGVGASGFSCPQHRCVGCERSTAAAGGLLFRCVDCAAAFCEDCLAEDAVESLGRWGEMEALGYQGRQAYWIRCEECIEGGGDGGAGGDGGGGGGDGDGGGSSDEEDVLAEDEVAADGSGGGDGGGDGNDGDDGNEEDDDGDEDKEDKLE